LFHKTGILKQEEEWNNGKLWNISPYITIYGDSLDPGTLKNGKGIKLDYYRTGEVKIKCEFDNGVPDGSWNFYYDDGDIAEKGSFSEGLKNGSWYFYHKNGKLSLQAEYENGEKSGVWSYYDTFGNLTERIDYDEK